MDNIELSYYAGFFDADGCVTIGLKNQADTKRGRLYRMSVEVCQKAPSILEAFQDVWGGTITSGHRAYRWYLYGDNAARFLRDVLPYLRLKREEACIAIDFQGRKSARGARGSAGLTHREFLGEEADYEACKQLRINRP